MKSERLNGGIDGVSWILKKKILNTDPVFGKSCKTTEFKNKTKKTASQQDINTNYRKNTRLKKDRSFFPGIKRH